MHLPLAIHILNDAGNFYLSALLVDIFRVEIIVHLTLIGTFVYKLFLFLTIIILQVIKYFQVKYVRRIGKILILMNEIYMFLSVTSIKFYKKLLLLLLLNSSHWCKILKQRDLRFLDLTSVCKRTLYKSNVCSFILVTYYIDIILICWFVDTTLISQLWMINVLTEGTPTNPVNKWCYWTIN